MNVKLTGGRVIDPAKGAKGRQCFIFRSAITGIDVIRLAGFNDAFTPHRAAVTGSVTFKDFFITGYTDFFRPFENSFTPVAGREDAGIVKPHDKHRRPQFAHILVGKVLFYLPVMPRYELFYFFRIRKFQIFFMFVS